MNHERSNKIRAAIETAVYRAIFDDTLFAIDLPKLTPELWERVSIRTPDNVNENERLEFLGDSLMDASIAIALYKIVPEGTPHKYTVSLTAHSTDGEHWTKRQGHSQRVARKPYLLPPSSKDEDRIWRCRHEEHW